MFNKILAVIAPETDEQKALDRALLIATKTGASVTAFLTIYDFSYRIEILWTFFNGTVKINDMNNFSSLIFPSLCHSRRIIRKDRFCIHTPLGEPYTLSIFYINCRDNKHRFIYFPMFRFQQEYKSLQTYLQGRKLPSLLQ